jgi:site-specific recombinase XerD
MLTLFRWHKKRCPHDSRDYIKCQCPIWMDWTLPDGQRVRKSLGLKDWQAAQRRAREMEANGITSGGETVTIEKAIEAFEADAKTTVKPSTLKQYKIILGRLEKFAKEKGYVFLKQLGVVQVRDFRNSWTTYSPRTSGKHIERLKRFFRWCVENRWLEQSPATPLKSPKAGDTDVIPFSEGEVEKILKACEAYEGPNKTRLIVLTNLMLSTGLAIGDATMMSKNRITKNGHGHSVELRRAKTETAVSCPIADDLAESVLALDGETPFWTGKSDLEDLTKIWRKIFTKIFEAAGIEGHPHQFRHTCAKRLLVKGVPTGFVATVLGDGEDVVRKHYSKWIPERQAALESAIRSTWQPIPSADARQTKKRASK